MRFYIEFDDKENFVNAAPQIIEQLSIFKGEKTTYLEAPKFNLYGCLSTELFLDKEGHWKMEFLPEIIN
jgi:hypothetical protein